MLSLSNDPICYMSSFQNGYEQRQLLRCCKRTRSLIEEACKKFCIKHSSLLSNSLQEKNVHVLSWCQVRHHLIRNPIVFSEQLYVSHIHGWEGRRNEGFTHERRTWIVNQIWAANGRPGTADDLRGCDQFHVCQKQVDGITCYKIPHGIDERFCLITESGKTTVSSSLPHRQWKPIKLATATTFPEK